MQDRGPIVPRARSSDLAFGHLPGELLVYDQRNHRAHCLNDTAARIWQHCDGQTAIPVVAEWLAAEWQAPVDDAFVWTGLDQLARAGLLEDTIGPGHALPPSRREFLRRAGVTAAGLALPLILTMVPGSTALAASCRGAGKPCSASAQCCSGLCSGGVCVGGGVAPLGGPSRRR
ncbi:MAG TPA: PqqD family protein [Chloroflexia bacterium]|nr:PqqD family protein [Chloroflexia bacterium]